MGIEVMTGDITALAVDVVVNAANEQLAHGGGVARAIARAGAPVVDEESQRWIERHGPLGAGDAAHTRAGEMAASWVVHVVGPRYRKGQDNERLLRQAVAAALGRASELGARSVAFPAISAGVFGYPRPEATAVIASEVDRWLATHAGQIDRVVLVGFDEATTDDFRAGLSAV